MNEIKMNFIEKFLLPRNGLKSPEMRENWIKEKLHQIPEKSTILDVGAGELAYKKYCKHLNYFSTDFGKYTGHENDIGLQVADWEYGSVDVIGDAANLMFKNESFDAVLLSEVLEHVPFPIEVLKEVSRILKKGGVLILTAPFASLTHFAPYFYCTGFSSYFYNYHLPKCGFNIIEIKNNGGYYDVLSTELMRTKIISKKYIGRNLNLFEQFIIFLSLKILEKFSKLDKNSKELWCWEYDVVAKKS